MRCTCGHLMYLNFNLLRRPCRYSFVFCNNKDVQAVSFSLQVKGLSIEHEKLAVAHSQTNMDSPLDSPTSRKQLKVMKDDGDGQSMPSPSYSPAMSPYMHPHHYRQYEQRLPATGASFDHKRPLRSPNEMLQESVRASVLRDGSKAGRPPSPGPMSLAYRPSSSSSCSLPPQPEADAPPENRFDPDPAATALICPESNTAEHCQDPGCPEGTRKNTRNRTNFLIKHENAIKRILFPDLRMKMEPNQQQEEPLSSTVSGNGSSVGAAGAANGSLGPMSKYECDRDKTDLIPTTLWNSVTGKLSHKTGSSSVTTPDGTFIYFFFNYSKFNTFTSRETLNAT